MQKQFIRTEDIQKVYGGTLNPNEDFSKRFFVGWDDITIENNIYALDKSKADYDAFGDAVEAAYLKNVKFIILSFNFSIFKTKNFL